MTRFRLLDLVWRLLRSFFFAISIFLCLALSQILTNNSIARYDILLVCCLSLQFFMYRCGWESRSEVAVISLFHAMGLAMELFKVYMHSWSYPEPAFTKIFGVPLYSGFMYASVASFICQSWKLFGIELRHWPRASVAWLLAAFLYFNFFSQHFFFDLRWLLLAAVLFSFRNAEFHIHFYRRYKVNAVRLFVAMGIMIWCAENIATFLGAWQYTYQHKGWRVVHAHKVLSWTLMSIVSIIVVVELKFIKAGMRARAWDVGCQRQQSEESRSEELEALICRHIDA